jgi:hypothetical protein
MYTPGHVAILRDAMMRLRGGSRGFFGADRGARRRGWYELAKALSYPDFPCGRVQVLGDAVLEERMEACGLLQLGAAMLLDRLSLGHQSHNGFYSLWHAMTYDPDKPVENIARNICEYVLICCQLAHERRSLFWLGFALHIVMDAYSPAHTLRIGEGAQGSGDLVTWVHVHESELAQRELADVKLIRTVIGTVVDGVAAGDGYLSIVERAARPVGGQRGRDLAAFVLFDHLQRRRLPFNAGVWPPPRRRKEENDGSSRQQPPHPILNFLYYPRQHGLFHTLQDRLAAVKAAGLYNACVRDVADMLRLYRSGLSQPRARYLRGVHRLMATRTLAVHPQCAHADTGFDAQTALDPSARKTLVFASTASDPDVYVHKGTGLTIRRRRSKTRRSFELPITRNVHTRPSVQPVTFSFAASARPGERPPVPGTVAYTFVDAGAGFPVSLVDGDAGGVTLTRPVLQSATTAPFTTAARRPAVARCSRAGAGGGLTARLKPCGGRRRP